jgi:hypothetical protein
MLFVELVLRFALFLNFKLEAGRAGIEWRETMGKFLGWN